MTTQTGGFFTSRICKTEVKPDITSVSCLVYGQGKLCPWFCPVPHFEKALDKTMEVIGTKLSHEIRLKAALRTLITEAKICFFFNAQKDASNENKSEKIDRK